MIHVTLTYEGQQQPECCALDLNHLMKHLARFSLNTRLTAITLEEDGVLVHWTHDHIINLRTHARKLMSNGAVAPILGSSLRKEAASA